jgi:REP element-mobilizing transposase RayT
VFADLGNGRILLKSLKHQHDRGHVESLCFVIMPDHLHWLLQLGSDRSLSDVIGVVKSFSAYTLNAKLNERGRIWQPGFHDHALREEEDLQAVARYIVANPLRAGLVSRIGDYSLWDAVWL